MAVTEESRHLMHVRFAEVVGPDVALTLMEHLPPVGWADVATKADLAHQTALQREERRAEMADLRGELKAEMADRRGELKAEMADLRAEMADLRAEIDRRFQRLLLQLIGAMAGFITIVFTVAFTLAKQL